MTRTNECVNDRQLSSTEKSFELLNRNAGDSFGVAISRIKAREEQLQEEILMQALDFVQLRHPLINSHIAGPINDLRFQTAGTHKIPLRVVNNPTQNQQWQNIAIEELNEKIEVSQNLMRVVLIYSTDEDNISYLITTIHHAIVDGLSGTRLHQDILTYYQRVVTETQPIEVSSLPAVSSLEKLIPESMKGIKGTTKRIDFLGRMTIKTLFNKVETLGFEKVVAVDLRHCGLIHKELDTELTKKFTNTCKRKRLSLQPSLCAVMLFTVARKIIKKRKSFSKNSRICVNSQSAVDLRKKLNPVISNEQMGLFASILLSFHTLQTNTSFWELAQDVKQQLRHGIKKGDVFSITSILEKLIKSSLSHPNNASITTVTTNIGKVNIPRFYGPFEIESISFAPSVSLLGGVLVAAITIFAGKMRINFTFSEPSISYETAELLANDFVFCLKEVCQREDVFFEPSEQV